MQEKKDRILSPHVQLEITITSSSVAKYSGISSTAPAKDTLASITSFEKCREAATAKPQSRRLRGTLVYREIHEQLSRAHQNQEERKRRSEIQGTKTGKQSCALPCVKHRMPLDSLSC